MIEVLLGRSRIDIPGTQQSYWALAGSGGGRTLRDGQVRPKELLVHVFDLVLWPSIPDPGAIMPYRDSLCRPLIHGLQQWAGVRPMRCGGGGSADEMRMSHRRGCCFTARAAIRCPMSNDYDNVWQLICTCPLRWFLQSVLSISKLSFFMKQLVIQQSCV